MQERGQVQCVRLLEKLGKGGAVEGWGSWGAEGTLPLPLLPLLCFQALVLFVLSQIDYGSARSVVPSLL